MARKSRANDKVDLNRASAEELDQIYGVGPKIARKIVEYRESERGGRFHSVQDLTHIEGIGAKTAQLIMRHSTV